MFATTLSIPIIHMVEEENQHLKWSSDLHMCVCSAPQINKWNKTKQIKVLPSPQWTKKVTHRQRGWTPQAYSSRDARVQRTLARYCKEQRSPDHATSCMKSQLYLRLSPSARDLRSSKASHWVKPTAQDLAVIEWERKWTSNGWWTADRGSPLESLYST